MEEDRNVSKVLVFRVENKIRTVQSDIQTQLDNFETGPNTTFAKTSYVCDSVRDDVLNYEDEPHLSKAQNNRRRIFIASELFISFCSTYAHIVDYEYAQIIRDMMDWDKYKSLSMKIRSKMQLELKREKYFMGEAQSKLLKSLEGARIGGPNEIAVMEREERKPETKVGAENEGKGLSRSMEQLIGKETLGHEISRTLAPPSESSFRNEVLSDIGENLTQIRGEPMADTFQLELSISDTSKRVLPLPNVDTEISIRGPPSPQKDDDDISKILQILEDESFTQGIPEIQQPENLLESTNKSQDIPKEIAAENPPTDDWNPAEGSEEWSLPGLEVVEKTRTKRLIIDKATIIPDYAAKALQMNKNISIQRVQVFEGPPTVLRSISTSHLMTTPGYRSSPFLQDVRSSKLNTLYNRHLVVEKKPVEQVLPRKRTIEEPKETDISKVRKYTEIMEDVGMRAGMHSRHDKSDVLAEVPEKTQVEALDITAGGVPPKESLVGVPMSRIINSTIEPPEADVMERINAAPILPTPRAQQLQGKQLEPRTSPPWFFSTKQNPPCEKYRKFNYVYEKLQMYWSLCESQEREKCITMREFFSFEADGSVADFLTVLRIVDKMSIQRKLLLEYKRGDVFIRPFENPYVSNAQLLLKEKEPVL